MPPAAADPRRDPAAAPAILDAVLERITFANQETGYTVARVATDRARDLLTVVGPLLGAQPGERLRLEGRWTSHPQYGRQFEARRFTTVLPASAEGIRRYLGSGLIKGIGPRTAERIVACFGADALRVIDEEPARLLEVAGLGPRRQALIAAAWQEQQAVKEVMVFLQEVGVSTALAARIYKTYRDQATTVVRSEPYRLAADVWGVGFKTADLIAQRLGIPHDSPQRVKAGLRYALSRAADDGHCYLPEPELLARAGELLGVDAGLDGRCLQELVAEGGVVREPAPDPQPDGAADGSAATHGAAAGDAVWLPPFHRAEVGLARGLARLLGARNDRLAAFREVDWPAALAWLRGTSGSPLAPEQDAAVRLALTQRVALLTGGPGCGKSFTVRAIVALARARHAKVVLAAPTGRAAKRLAELAGHEAATLHRLLELRPGGDAAYGSERPLDADLVVVDEASMLDLLLANTLVKAVPSGAHLLLVGDADQLPSVGPGQVLRDLLAAGTVPQVRLTRIFRQARHSGVVVNAHRINAGQPPLVRGLEDFFLFREDDPERTADLVVDIVAERLPRRFGLDPRRDVQVLCPMHRGPAGAGALNERLQRVLTPPDPARPERRHGARAFRVGDKVTQVRNDYGKGVFNGAVGLVTAVSVEDQQLLVRMDDDQEVAYGFDELDELLHAYAVTIHRSQGSEYPCVVVPLTTSAWLMLQRNLLYTAVTRAKRLVVLVGSSRALAKAVRSQSGGRRWTALAARLAASRPIRA